MECTFLTDKDKVVRYDAQALTEEQKTQARENIGAAAPVLATDEKYFGITDDGTIYLLPAYRGASIDEYYEHATSDNGVGVAGSKNAELPEEIVIPEFVNGIPVTAYTGGMFFKNLRVKRLFLLDAVKTLPNEFCSDCYNLTDVSGTEKVEAIGTMAFAASGIVKANFPSLKRSSGTYQFYSCWNLLVADLGNEITEIPAGCFTGCDKLTIIRNAENVTTIGETGLYFTKRLMTPAFVGNLESVGDCGLLFSRSNYDWNSLTGCSFGTMAKPTHFNATDFWSGCTTTPCNTPMRSTFEQHNPLWANKQIGNINRTYSTGCMYISAAMVYSALMGFDMESPEEFVEIVRHANPELMDDTGDDIADDYDYYVGLEAWLEAVGLKVDRRTAYTADNLQAMYDALANGALVISRVPADYLGNNHTVVFHGINTKGELLITDPAAPSSIVAGVYEASEYVMPIQNIVRGAEDCFVIVTK